MQAHDLHQHLVGVRGAVKGAGAGAVIGAALGLEQLRPPDLALGVELADPGLLAVGQARGHGAGGHEDRRQMAEGERRHHETRHDLVADAEVERAIEHVVRERDRGGERDHVAREQRQLHAGAALGDAIAHRRHAARELGDPARPAHRLLDQGRETLERLVRREHVVVGRDDCDVRPGIARERLLVVAVAGGKAVREVAAGEPRPLRAAPPGLADPLEIGLPRRGAAPRDARRHLGDARMDRHGLRSSLPMIRSRARRCHYAASSYQVRRSRSIRAIAADGPQLPAG
jgi:hypothetical protein